MSRVSWQRRLEEEEEEVLEEVMRRSEWKVFTHSWEEDGEEEEEANADFTVESILKLVYADEDKEDDADAVK